MPRDKLLHQVSTIRRPGTTSSPVATCRASSASTLPPPPPTLHRRVRVAPASDAVQIPTGPIVRVYRGHSVTQEPIGGAVRGMVNAQSNGVDSAAGSIGAGAAAGVAVG